MAKFLLDENLSPKISRHLEIRHGFDAVPLRELGRLGIPDANVRDLAIRHGRVLITRDRDFIARSNARSPIRPGILWVTLQSGSRSVHDYIRALDRFFDDDMHKFDIQTSIIEVNERFSRLLDPQG